VRVRVCSWDPEHTYRRKLAQEQAFDRGELAAIVRRHEGDQESLIREMLPYVTSEKEDGEDVCPDCRSPMESVYSADGIEDELSAMEDVAVDLSAAIDRTRKRRC